MRTTQKRYSAELQEQLVRLARSGRSPKELSREYEPSDERDELARLRRENARLKEEREIFSKAAAWFAQETEKKSKGSSRS